MHSRAFDRRQFLALAGGGAMAVAFRGQLRAEETPAWTRPFLVSTAGSGRATGYAEASKIITVGERTHVAWLDADAGGFHVRIRTLDRATGAWSAPCTLGGAQDNHGGPALTVDPAGYLHAVYYPHHGAFRYRRSLRPNDASAWEPEIEFGEGLSYPVMLCDRTGTIILTARRRYVRDAAGRERPWELELWKKPVDGSWRRERTVLRSRHPNYAHFQESLAWGPDQRTIHLGCRIHETTGANEAPLQTAGYLVSPDAGVTWTRADGSPLTLPVTADTIDVLATGGGASGRILYSGAIAVNARGGPHAIFTLREKDGPARTYLATPAAAGRGWTKRDLHEHLPAEKRSWDLVTPGGMTFSASGRATLVATLAKLGGPKEIDWAHPSNEVVRFWSDDEARSFQTEILALPGAGRPRWLPSLERPTGNHPVPAQPGIMFTAGGGGAGLHERELNNQVWWMPGNASLPTR